MSEKKQIARDSLPEELRGIFDDFVAEYKFCSTLRVGSPYICYAVMADLVRAGWRKSADGFLPKIQR